MASDPHVTWDMGTEMEETQLETSALSAVARVTACKMVPVVDLEWDMEILIPALHHLRLQADIPLSLVWVSWVSCFCRSERWWICTAWDALQIIFCLYVLFRCFSFRIFLWYNFLQDGQAIIFAEIKKKKELTRVLPTNRNMYLRWGLRSSVFPKNACPNTPRWPCRKAQLSKTASASPELAENGNRVFTSHTGTRDETRPPGGVALPRKATNQGFSALLCLKGLKGRMWMQHTWQCKT